MVAYTVFSNPGDVLMACTIPTGGHISHSKESLGGTAGLVRKLDVQNYPFDEEAFTIDVDKTSNLVKELSGKARPLRSSC